MGQIESVNQTVPSAQRVFMKIVNHTVPSAHGWSIGLVVLTGSFNDNFMEQQDSIIYDGFPPISSKYPWLVAQNPDAEQGGQVFYNLNDPMSTYQCRIPELFRKRIRGCFHGWLILSQHPYNDNLTFSLWNPNTSKIICLPPLILKDGDYESIGECCLSSPPDDPTSILLLTRTNKPVFVFIRLHRRRKSVPWIEMSYDKQLKRITGRDGVLVYSLASCNGKVYALNTNNGLGNVIINVDILVKDREVLIKLSLFGICPYNESYCSNRLHYLKGSGTELFYISVGFHGETQQTPGGFYFFKLDMTSIKREEVEVFKGLDMTNKSWEDTVFDLFDKLISTRDMWEEMLDLKDTIFFVDVSRDHSVFYSPMIASKYGGFLHIRGKMDEIIFSYHVKKKTISLSSMPFPVLPTSNVFLWECRLEDDHGEAPCTIDFKQNEEDKMVVRSVMNQDVESKESHLLNLPFPILESIMKLCVGVEYMKFRATCKLCHLAAPPIQWGNETGLRRFQTYSLVSPWLVVVNENEGVLTFTDPLFGGSYFMNNIQVSFDCRGKHIEDKKILCSRFGWLLFYHKEFRCPVFFNPFTSEFRKIPNADYTIKTACFSAPPTSPDCMIVGFSKRFDDWHVLIHYVAQESSWRTFSIDAEPLTIHFPTLKKGDLYALCNEGKLIVFKDLGEEDYSWKRFETQAPISCRKSFARYFLTMTCDHNILQVVVGELGEFVEVFKWNDATKEWEKIDRLGKHMIFIGSTTCICIEAKIHEMENKIYFPRLQSENGKIVFYSLETCMYHNSSGKIIAENFKDFIGTDCHLNSHTWIEPSWS